jgi:fatty acid desaturase
MHGSILKKRSKASYLLGFLGFSLWWMPLKQWQYVHNKIHHTYTNGLKDPDRNYLYQQPKTWGKWLQNLFVPSSESNMFWVILGLGIVWGGHDFRNLSSVLLFPDGNANYVPAAFTVKPKERIQIALELLGIIGIHLSILMYLQFQLTPILLGYFLPIAIGHAIIVLYVYMQHIICPMTEVNDPLVNSISLKLPNLINKLHFNFSYHTEHHIFPNMNSDYYPLVQNFLQEYYPDRMNIITVKEAWQLLLKTPRHYLDETTFVGYSGEGAVACPLPKSTTASVKTLETTVS